MIRASWGLSARVEVAEEGKGEWFGFRSPEQISIKTCSFPELSRREGLAVNESS